MRQDGTPQRIDTQRIDTQRIDTQCIDALEGRRLVSASLQPGVYTGAVLLPVLNAVTFGLAGWEGSAKLSLTATDRRTFSGSMEIDGVGKFPLTATVKGKTIKLTSHTDEGFDAHFVGKFDAERGTVKANGSIAFVGQTAPATLEVANKVATVSPSFFVLVTNFSPQGTAFASSTASGSAFSTGTVLGAGFADSAVTGAGFSNSTVTGAGFANSAVTGSAFSNSQVMGAGMSSGFTI
jgi:hypothetical protein